MPPPPGGPVTVDLTDLLPCAEMLKPGLPVGLTAAQKQSYRDEGFVLLPGALCEAFCARAIEALQHIEDLGNRAAGVARPAGFAGLTQDIDGSSPPRW
jgi:hypothetical protein